jgi:hypothetical protein
MTGLAVARHGTLAHASTGGRRDVEAGRPIRGKLHQLVHQAVVR